VNSAVLQLVDAWAIRYDGAACPTSHLERELGPGYEDGVYEGVKAGLLETVPVEDRHGWYDVRRRTDAAAA
jgi:hypothetical protein